MFFKESKLEMMGELVDMEETGSGHYSIPISATRQDSKFKEVVQCLICDKEGLSYKEVEKLHHYFGHVSVNKLEQLIRNSNQLDEKTRGFINEVKEKCISCKKNKNKLGLSWAKLSYPLDQTLFTTSIGTLMLGPAHQILLEFF